jgi:molybdenum cofactor cytidylyltransferase
VPLVVPVHAGGTGHPVLFDRCLFDELRVLRGDVGARAVVRRHWAEAVQVVAEPVLDIDTEAAYVAALARRFGR